MERNNIADFLTPEFSYLLGLITGRGEIQQTSDFKRIVIDFEYKTLESTSITQSFNQRLHIQTSLDPVLLRLQNLGINARKVISENKISLILNWANEDISWLFIKFLINGNRFSYHDFQVPSPIFITSTQNKKEFLRGFGDTTGYVRASNYFGYNADQPKRYRVYLEVSNKNWLLPPQLCKLLQTIGVPVQTINYGHPNLRDPNNKKGNNFWAKEHQMKVFAEDYQMIGFYISHKDMALAEMAESNLSNFDSRQSICEGTISRSRTKPSHPDESSDRLPESLRNQHFNSFKEICNCLGCYQQND